MNINTEIKKIIVNIDGLIFEVAENNVATAEKLTAINKKYVGHRKQYEAWLAALEVFLGEKAVQQLFPDVKAVNLDRLENIYAGVSFAYTQNSRDLAKKRNEEQLVELDKMVDRIKPAMDILKTVEDNE